MPLTKGCINREGRVSFGDASLAVWEEGLNPRMSWNEREAWERQFKLDVFARIVQQLNRLGWTCEIPEDYVKQYSLSFARNHRRCRKGDLKADLSISGRHIEFKMFQSINCPTRPDHEGRYEWDKEACMPYVMRLEMERTRRRIRDYLCNVFEGYVFEQPAPTMGIAGVTALEYAAHIRRTTGHYVPELDRARICNTGYDTSADGHKLENGTRVFAMKRDGRMVTGTAFYDLNGNWIVVTGRYGYTTVWHKQIWVQNPGNLRDRRDTGIRRKRLEAELARAVKAMNFERAAVLRNVLFPKREPLFVVWHEGHSAYHCAGFSGYANDVVDAGKFTAEEVKNWASAPNKIIPLQAV